MEDAASLQLELAELEERRQHLAVAYATNRVLAESATLPEATPRILRAICELLGWEYGALWIVDARGDHLSCVESWHAADADFSEFDASTRRIQYPSGMGLPGMVWANGKPAWLSDVPVGPQ